MDDLYDRDRMESENKDEGSLYLDCVRSVEGGHIRRFENLAKYFDIVQYELNDGPSKSLLFYAIEHNDEMFMKILLDMEIPLEKKYTIMVPSSPSATAELVPKHLNAQEYAHELHHEHLAEIISHRLKLPSYEKRFFRVLQMNDIRLCDKFLRRLLNENRQYSYAIQGLFTSAQLGSVRLLDYFLTRWKINVNAQRNDHEQYPTTALLTAITYQQNEAAKFLLFRHADPSMKGKYDNALVTALHYHSSNDLLRLLLDKHVDLTARHPDYLKLNLREYCILTDRVQAKTELDAYIIRLIGQGNYSRLKWLVDHGYQCINVNITTKRNGKQLAKERYYDRIVKLIDDVESAQRKAKIKMNY